MSTILLIFNVVLYVLSSATLQATDDATKRKILHPFNEKADINKYIVYCKKYHLPALLQYLCVVGNTWSAAARKLKTSGYIWLADQTLVNDNCVYIIIPPVCPTPKILSTKRLEAMVVSE